jgi:hypothetical protein
VSSDNLIRQTSRLVDGRGDPCDFGCTEEDLPSKIQLAKAMFPEKPYCAVAKWCWGDLDVSPGMAEEISQAGMQPSFVFANEIVEDEAGRWNKGLSVKTTLLVGFHERCLFVTRNTAYILVETGSRMTVAPAVYVNLVF